MRYWPRLKPRRALRLGWLLLLLLLSSSTVLAVGFRVLNAEARLADGVLLLDADADFSLSNPAQDALRNSVPLILVLRVQVLAQGNWLWNNTVAELEQRHQLRYHPLAQQFVAVNLNTGTLQSFPSQRAALRYIGRLRDFPVIDQGLLPASGFGRLRAELDVDSLPAPLKPLAYLSPSWRLSSDWYRWSFR